MTKSRPSLRSLAGTVLSCLLICVPLAGCTPSFAPTYSKETLDAAVRDLCKKEYGFDVTTRLLTNTLWIYLPIEDLFEKAKKPERLTERFSIDYNQNELRDGNLRVQYVIKPLSPERTRMQDVTYNKKEMEKINNVWKVLRRVIFSMERSHSEEVRFYCLVVADVKNGIEIREYFYAPDLKKVSYDFISWSEYQHRSIQETGIFPAIIGDWAGVHVEYREMTMAEFISKQIEQRIRLKFQKPEVEKGADIDGEIMKIVAYTLRIYDFKGFDRVEFNNLFTNSSTILSRDDIEKKSIK